MKWNLTFQEWKEHLELILGNLNKQTANAGGV